MLVTQTYRKIYTNENVQYLDMTNSMFYSLFDILNNVAIKKRETTEVPVLNNKTYNDIYDDLLKTTKTKASTVYSQIATQKNVDSMKDTKTYENLRATMNSLQTITTKLGTLQSANITAIETLYAGYQTQIQKYVNNLITMMTTINSQITTLSTDTVYSPMIQPLQNIFRSIRNTLVNNTKTIKQLYTGFEPSKIPVLEGAKKYLSQRRLTYLWDKYKIVFAIITGLLITLLIFLS